MLIIAYALMFAVPFAAIAIVAALVLAVLRDKRRRAWMWLVVAPLGIGATPITICGLMLGFDAIQRATRPPSEDFGYVFARPPTAAITGLRAAEGLRGRERYLVFDRSDAALAEVVAGQRLTTGPMTDGVAARSDYTPDWWRPAANCVERRELPDHEGGRGGMFVIDCPAQRRIYVLSTTLF